MSRQNRFMNLDMLDDFRLKVFESVAREGSFTRAARQLGVTQSAVSQSVAELERQLGVQLFVRSRSRVSLTREGKSFAGYASRILYWYGAAGKAFSAGAAAEEIVVSASADAASFIVPEMISPLVAGSPACRVKVVCGGGCPEASVSVTACPADAGNREGKGECAGLSPLCAVALPSDRNAYSGVSSLSEVDACLALWTGLDGEIASVNGYDAAWSRMAGLENMSRVIFISSSAASVVEMVESNEGVVGVVPLYAVYNKLADRTLSRLPLISSPGAAAVFVQPSGSFSNTAQYSVMRQRLMDFLRR